MQGQASVAWTARPGAVAGAVLSQAHVMAMVLAPPCAVAVAEGVWRLAVSLGAPLAAVLAAAALARRFPPPGDLRGIEAAAVFVILFVGLAVLALPSFMVLGLAPVDALFESVSAITSTGLTVATGTLDWPLAGHALRGWMQWSGGFAIAVAGVALILGPGSARAAARSLGRTNLSGGDLLSSTRAQARRLIVVYGALTVVAILVLLPLLPSWWEAVAIALTAVSTGGFTPRPDSLASYSRPAQAAVFVICLAASVSLMAYVLAAQKGLRAALARVNVGPVIALALTAGAVSAGLTLARGDSIADTLDAAFNTLSGATTAGFSVAPVAAAPAVMTVILAAMVVGGGSGSTAGGVKVDRVAVPARMVGVALLRLRAPPGAVTPLKADGTRITPDHMTSAGAVLFLFAVTALVAWAALCFGGVDPAPALFDAVSAVSTTGLSSGVVGPELAWPLKLVLAAAMLLGRLEFLALIAVLSPATWAPLHR